MSRESIAPIKVVPYIILYINGKPYMRYQGPQDAGEIARFIVEVSQKIQSKQSFTKEDKHIKQSKKGRIPAYTIGTPLCGPDDKVCYLEFDNAYGNDKVTGRAPTGRVQIPVGAGMGM